MAMTTVSAGATAAFGLVAAASFAQTPNLTPGCTATTAQLEANKKWRWSSSVPASIAWRCRPHFKAAQPGVRRRRTRSESQ